MQGFAATMLALTMLCALNVSAAFTPNSRFVSPLSLVAKNSIGNSNVVSNVRRSDTALAAVMPGDPLVTGTIAQGIMNGISLYSNIIFARIVLSYFPQLFTQFPILRPLITVTDPYLNVFRKTIPKIGGFDIRYIHIHIHTHTHTYTYTYTYTYTHTYTHIHSHTLTYTHIHSHTLTHTHIHIHSHTASCLQSSSWTSSAAPPPRLALSSHNPIIP
jgi:uncharacterized protein YggT (Ycf19 family)